MIVDIKTVNYPQLPLPGYRSMAVQVSKAVVRSAALMMTGGSPTVSKEERKRRSDICHKCDWYDRSRNRCRKCGCGIAGKTYLKVSKCPIGKW
jgi:predicted RNA-binding Zn ribbon-like protein